MRFYFIMLMLFLCSSCDINNQKLLFINKTNNPIYFCLLTDTVLSTDLQLNKVFSSDSIKPNFTKGGKGAWEYKINNDSSDSTLHIYIFKSDSITDDIIKNKQFKRFDYNVKELEDLNWTIVLFNENE
jgi:hypothetical protein